MKQCNDVLIDWLKRAYAMEKSLGRVLSAHAKDAEEFPDLKQMLLDHVDETEKEAEELKSQIERLGENVSKLGEESAELMGMIQGGMSMGDDKIIKNLIAEHAAEHFEMATYLTIAKVAENCGDEEIREMAQHAADEEKETAEKLEQNLGMAIDDYMQK